ncbi:N-acetyltransferase [Roseibacterium sp. SDUM158017]|uniref:N-acetyltransferase n=1 Tax=Roseicyclus salinarum TaxID=3036773 RepID=UPI0024157BE4|nr:N-acetyltransferase [Roseibacterium sp. SDUM158017]MDG4648131.1 N-acetyltransferase [Roseibacterium sp. SDUM158017]
MTAEGEFFGNDQQRALLRRGRALAGLICGDRRYHYYGRTVGIASTDDGDADDVATLAVVQGNSSCAAVPRDRTAGMKAALKAHGLSPMHYVKWTGGASALAAAREIVATRPLPEDLTLVRIDGATPAEHMASLAAMSLGCGVMPLIGEVLRGGFRRACCIAALDAGMNVVSCAASSSYAHEDHGTYGRQAWWGMLATDPSRRGEGLSRILGAHVMLDMEERFGIRDFMTGIEAGNAPSEAVCSRMGLAPGAFDIVVCADPAALAGGRLTK